MRGLLLLGTLSLVLTAAGPVGGHVAPCTQGLPCSTEACTGTPAAFPLEGHFHVPATHPEGGFCASVGVDCSAEPMTTACTAPCDLFCAMLAPVFALGNQLCDAVAAAGSPVTCGINP